MASLFVCYIVKHNVFVKQNLWVKNKLLVKHKLWVKQNLWVKNKLLVKHNYLWMKRNLIVKHNLLVSQRETTITLLSDVVNFYLSIYWIFSLQFECFQQITWPIEKELEPLERKFENCSFRDPSIFEWTEKRTSEFAIVSDLSSKFH